MEPEVSVRGGVDLDVGVSIRVEVRTRFGGWVCVSTVHHGVCM